MDLIKINDLVKARGPSFTLGPLNINLLPGEILGVMGPNGAGKTSLLRLLWGFLRPDQGSISIFGMTPHLTQIQMRRLAGFVGDSTRFYEWMSAREYLAFVSGFYPTFDSGEAKRLLDHLGLEGSTRIERLSRGGRVKLALIGALAHHPKLVILDEPTAGLDPLVRAELLRTLKDMASGGVGVVLSSHLMSDLDQTADSVLMLDHGRAVEYGPTDALLDKYSHAQLEEVFLNAIARVPPTGPSHRA